MLSTNTHVHINFLSTFICLMSICVHQLRRSIFLRTKQLWLNFLLASNEIKSCCFEYRVVYQFVFKLQTLPHEFYQNFLTLNRCHHLSMSLTFLKHIY